MYVCKYTMSGSNGNGNSNNNNTQKEFLGLGICRNIEKRIPILQESKKSFTYIDQIIFHIFSCFRVRWNLLFLFFFFANATTFSGIICCWCYLLHTLLAKQGMSSYRFFRCLNTGYIWNVSSFVSFLLYFRSFFFCIFLLKCKRIYNPTKQQQQQQQLLWQWRRWRQRRRQRRR